jgi:HK97 family phage major capsid protein
MNDHAAVSQAVDGLMSAFEEFKANSDKRLDKIEMRLNRPGATALFDRGKGDLAAERKAIGAFAKTGSDVELKSMEVGVDPAGGWFTLPEMSSQMTRKLWDSSPIRRLARVQVMTSGDSWQEPLDRDESAAEWVAELQARPALDTPQVGLLDTPLNEIYTHQVSARNCST